MNKTFKWIIFSVAALILLIFILKKTGITGSTDEIKVITEKIQRRNIIETVNASGKIYPETEIKITPDISGEITELNVHEGDSVKKGQVLVHVSSGTIVSPAKGTVLLMNVKKGERVSGNPMVAGLEIMRIGDLSKLEVRVDVGENDIQKVSLGDSAIIEIDAYNGRKFKGLVTKIAASNNGSASSMAPGNDVTSYKVHITLLQNSFQDLIDSVKNKISPFKPGMSASADIQTKTHINKLAVPINAVTIRDKNDSAANYISQKNSDANASEKNIGADDLEEVIFILQKNGLVKKVPVKTDIQDMNYIEILSMPNEGGEVITGPYEVVNKILKDGTRVKVVSKNDLFDKKK